MKAKEVLNLLKISRNTLGVYVKQRKLGVTRLHNGYYDYSEEDVYKLFNGNVERKTVIYGRVSTSKQKKDLENQIEMLKSWSFNSGHQINEVYSDVASGISFEKRKDFFKMLDKIINREIKIVIIAYKDRLSRIGFELFTHLFERFGTKIIVVSEIGNKKLDSEEIFEEIISMLHCYSMRHYSKRRAKKIEIEVETS